jgi:hypothetical protein
MNLKEFFKIGLGRGHAQMLSGNLVVGVGGPSCVVVGRHSQLPLDGHRHADVFWIYLTVTTLFKRTAQGLTVRRFKETERGRCRPWLGAGLIAQPRTTPRGVEVISAVSFTADSSWQFSTTTA